MGSRDNALVKFQGSRALLYPGMLPTEREPLRYCTEGASTGTDPGRRRKILEKEAHIRYLLGCGCLHNTIMTNIFPATSSAINEKTSG